MGQHTIGLLWGAKAPAAPLGFDPDGDPYGYQLTMQWPGATWTGPRVRYAWPTGDGPPFLGVWIAVGASGKDGAPSLNTAWRPDGPLPREWRKRAEEARKLWREFALWCRREERVELRRPGLWLVPTEVA